jgi:hypothetical protein
VTQIDTGLAALDAASPFRIRLTKFIENDAQSLGRTENLSSKALVGSAFFWDCQITGFLVVVQLW